MVTASSSCTPTTPLAPSYVRETAKQRMINPEHAALKKTIMDDLAVIKEKLDSHGMHDELSKDIMDWHTQFVNSLLLKNVDPKNVLDSFINLLKEKLIDPISHDCLDEEAVLGTDGRTYGQISLDNYRNSSIAEEYKQGSPLDPENKAAFFTSPHHNVRYMLNWLRQNNALPESAEVKRPDIKPIDKKDDIKPQVTAVQSERIERLKARLADRQQNQQQLKQKEQEPSVDREIKRPESDPIPQADQKGERINQFFANLEPELARDVKEEVQQNVRQRVQEVAQHQFQQANDLAQRDRERNQVLDRMMDELENGIVALDRENEVLADIVNNVDGQIDEAQRDDARLRMTINQIKQQTKKKKKSWIKDLIVAAAIVGVCIFATWALCGALSAVGGAGANAAVLPQQGGAILKLAVVF